MPNDGVNIEKHIKKYAEYMRNYRKRKAQENKTQAGNSLAAYMREYRKRKRLEEDNCNNVPSFFFLCTGG
jgi:hypothetical protein